MTKQTTIYTATFADGSTLTRANHTGRSYAAAWLIRFTNYRGERDTVSGFSATTALATNAANSFARSMNAATDISVEVVLTSAR